MIAQTAHRLRAQMEHFSGNLSRGLSKPLRRFVVEALQGIVGRQSVLLSEIARSLNEPIALIKTENRLSRNLAVEALRARLQGALVAEASGRVGEHTLLILDLSDVVKPYGQKMEYLARVRDGSMGGDRRRLRADAGDRRRERGAGDHAVVRRLVLKRGG